MRSLLHPVLGAVRRPRLEARLIDDLLLMQHPFQANIPSINLVSKPMYHQINGILLASSKFGQFGQFISLGHYSVPYYQNTQRMFPNTPDMSQIVFSVFQKPVWVIWSCSKNYLSVRMCQGNFGCHESLRWLFRLMRKCQLPLWARSKVLGHEVALLSLENYRGRFVFILKVLGHLFFFFLTIIAIS